VKWRTGCEGRISCLKRDYGIRRTRLIGHEGRISCLKRDYGIRRTRLIGHEGARIWVGHGVLAHNLTKIARLIA